MSNYIINPYFTFGQPPPPATRNAWIELNRTTLGVAGDNIAVSGLPNKRWLMVLINLKSNGSINASLRFNGDAGNNYASRSTANGSGNNTNVNQERITMNFSGANASNNWIVVYIDNNPVGEKLVTSHYLRQQVLGSGTAPQRTETVGKWSNQFDPIDEVLCFNDNAGNYDIGSEVIVLGFDPADGLEATSNFWQPLASVVATVDGDPVTTGVFTPKKYLWVQFFNLKSLSASFSVMNFNADLGANYANRQSNNGAGDSTSINATRMNLEQGGGFQSFIDCFIVNETTEEKLIIEHSTSQLAGSGNSPIRSERVGKWADVAQQIDEVSTELQNSGTMLSGTSIKVWGHD